MRRRPAGEAGDRRELRLAYLIPRVAAGPFTCALPERQVSSAMVLSSYVWLGSAKQPVTPMGIVGAVVLVIGVIFTKR